MSEWRLTARLRTAITLAALAVLMLLGVTWGWAQITKPFPGKVDAAICVDTAYRAGDELFVQDVTVSVLNASAREGLAGRTLQDLHDVGFAEGQTANAPKGTAHHHAGRDLGERRRQPGREAAPGAARQGAGRRAPREHRGRHHRRGR